MKKTYGMAVYSESAFNESSAVGLLKYQLERKHRIKTFFKENDRTPNIDGFFELTENNGVPKKQFVVQIKKTKKLERLKSGDHKGMYPYRMETAFLYYVKEKVNENPAIYFVVDIENQRIFYVFLSDQMLINLQFEGKDTITFWFDQDDIYQEDRFYDEMLCIANKRNRNLTKGPKYPKYDIGKLQTAIDKLNVLLNSDFKVIKNTMFPNVWKFGIENSCYLDSVELKYINKKGEEISIKPKRVFNYGLYFREKGELDTGIRDFHFQENYFSFSDYTGKTSPDKYVDNVFNEIIQEFCKNPPIKLLPTKVLMEITYERHQKVCNLLDVYDKSVDGVLRKYHYLFVYLHRIFVSKELTEREEKFKKGLLEDREYHCKIDFIDPKWFKMNQEINNFINKIKNKTIYLANPEIIFEMLSKECLQYYFILNELRVRNIDKIERIWEYGLLDIYQDTGVNRDVIEQILLKWWKELPLIYEEFYHNVFEENGKYKFKLNASFSFDISNKKNYPVVVIANLYKPKNTIQLVHSNCKIERKFTEKDKINNVISKIESISAQSFINNKTLFYDGIRCWLYQGICYTLNIKQNGIVINGRRCSLF